MSIKYTVQQIENAVGSGEARPFVRLQQGAAMTTEQLAAKIAASSTLTPADVKAVMSELCHYAKEELEAGNRFYLPEIGYLSLSVGNTPSDMLPKGVLTGKDIFVRNVDFKPELRFLNEIKRSVSFEKSHYATASVSYTAEELWQKVAAFLSKNQYITCRMMRVEFGLTKYKATQWLNRFTAEHRLSKRGTHFHPLYFLAEG
jgi:predicted histone-like DNA-binding protein